MAWIIGKKADESIVEISNKRPAFTMIELETIFPDKLGCTADDLSFYALDDVSMNRIIDGQAYVITWSGGEITGADFTLEDSKPWAKVSTDKEYIEDDGIETASLTLEVWLPDLSAIATTVQRTNERVPITTPNGTRFVKLNIVDGVASANFKSTKSGTYVFPATPKRYGTMRIFNQVTIEVDDTNLLDFN